MTLEVAHILANAITSAASDIGVAIVAAAVLRAVFNK